MNVLETLLARNAQFARDGFVEGLRMMPSARIMVIGCVDPRVEPATVLGLEPGEAAVLRNVGGRVTPDVLAELALLGAVTRSAGAEMGPGWSIVVLQHTACGIVRIADDPDLGAYLGGGPDASAARSVSDPHAAVALDVAVLRAAPGLARAEVSGLVYDVDTGLIEVVPVS